MTFRKAGARSRLSLLNRGMIRKPHKYCRKDVSQRYRNTDQQYSGRTQCIFSALEEGDTMICVKNSQMILDNQVGETERDCFDGTKNFRDLTKTQKMANIPKTLFSA